eukprot:SAG11_NODE_456_length_9319_cov_5.131128_5_plen_140_part_00
MRVLALAPLVQLPALALAQQRFVNTDATTKYAAIGLVGPSLDTVGVTRVIGTVGRTQEPLMQQTELWEARCDNGYPNVLHNPDDPHGAFRLWYGCFTSGTKFATSQGSVSCALLRALRVGADSMACHFSFSIDQVVQST